MLFEGLDLTESVSVDVALSQGLLTTVLGMIVVFLALIVLIFISSFMSKAIRSSLANKPQAAPAAVSAAPAPVQAAPGAAFANRGETVAAITAAIATVIGKTGGGFRIHSIKKV